jgi:hypothetical protein
MKVSFIIEQIDLGNIALPEFQRGYVWNNLQVRGLMTSLYNKHPVGGLLIWSTTQDKATTRGDGPSPIGGSVNLLLDGQQRVTTLYGIIRGKPPKFFEGNAAAFTGLHFNLVDESFEFYAPVKMKDNPAWVSVTSVMQVDDLAVLLEPIQDRFSELSITMLTALSRLSKLQSIRETDFHAEYVSGHTMTIDTVVEIFNRVNSGGTKLSKGDLALATICASWPEARQELRSRLDKWKNSGYGFKLDWFLRCVTTVATGEAYFASLSKISTAEFQKAVIQAEKHVDSLLNIIADRLGLNHADVLGSPYSFPLMARYLEERGGKLNNQKERDKLLYWYVHSFLWGRYAGSTESVLSQDLNLLKGEGDPLDRLIGQLRQVRGDLRVRPDDFRTSTRGSRFYPMLYMLTRVHGARDLDSGIALHNQILGSLSKLQVHHTFPKAKLYKHGYDLGQVNSVANFMFLTQATNLAVSDRDPAVYLPAYEEMNPGVLTSQWVPADPELWEYENYPAFLEARRRLLAEASNQFLDGLLAGSLAEPLEVPASITAASAEPVVVEPADEELELLDCNTWVIDQGLSEGDFYVEVVDPETHDILAIIDLAWPDGLQEGLTQPVAILLNEDTAAEEIANNAGYRYFTDVPSFKKYVESNILTESIVAAD